MYPLALVVAIFSGAWPYVKLLLMLWCWLATARQLSPATRGRILEVVDLLGKWSLLDVFILVMFMVAFRWW